MSRNPRRVQVVAALMGALAALGAVPAAAQTVDPDTTPPDTTIVSGPSGTVQDPSATFEFSSDDASATFECSLDGHAYADCTSPTSYTDLPDGAHSFVVRAVDPAQNVDETPAKQDWTVRRPDTTPPDTSINDGPRGTVVDTQATFAFSADEAGATFECSKDGGVYVACTSPRTYYGMADGVHNFRVQAVDAAGNRDPTPASWDWTVRRPETTTTTTTRPVTPNSTNPEPTSSTGPPTTTSTAPVTGGFSSPSSSPAPTPGNKTTTTTAKPAKGGGAGGGTSTSSSTATTEAAPPAPVADPPGALVLPGLDPGAGGFSAAQAPSGGEVAIGESHMRQQRRRKEAMIGLGVFVGLLVLGGGVVLWYRRPGRYWPA